MSTHGAPNAETSTGVGSIPPDQCLRMLAVVGFGQAVFTSGGLPLVEPVPVTVHDGAVFFRSTRTAPVRRPTVVAVHADDVDPHTGGHWSVQVTGLLEMPREDTLSWAPGTLPRSSATSSASAVLSVLEPMITGQWLGPAHPDAASGDNDDTAHSPDQPGGSGQPRPTGRPLIR